MEVAISYLRQELLTLYKAETKCTGQTPEGHFFFLHLTVLGHWSSRRATAFVLLLALALTTIVSEYLPHNSAPALIPTAHVIFCPYNSGINTSYR